MFCQALKVPKKELFGAVDCQSSGPRAAAACVNATMFSASSQQLKNCPVVSSRESPTCSSAAASGVLVSETMPPLQPSGCDRLMSEAGPISVPQITSA